MTDLMPLAKLIAVYCEDFGNVTGGNLHIVLDDDNLRDSDLQFCIEEARRECDHLAVAIGELLLHVHEDERAKIIDTAKALRGFPDYAT